MQLQTVFSAKNGPTISIKPGLYGIALRSRQHETNANGLLLTNYFVRPGSNPVNGFTT